MRQKIEEKEEESRKAEHKTAGSSQQTLWRKSDTQQSGQITQTYTENGRKTIQFHLFVFVCNRPTYFLFFFFVPSLALAITWIRRKRKFMSVGKWNTMVQKNRFTSSGVDERKNTFSDVIVGLHDYLLWLQCGGKAKIAKGDTSAKGKNVGAQDAGMSFNLPTHLRHSLCHRT